MWTPDSATPNSTAASKLASPLPFLFSSGFSWTTASEGTRAASWCPTWDCYGESFLPEHHICWSSSSVALRSQATAGCPGGAHPQVARHKTPRLHQHEAGSWEPGLSSGLDSRYRATVTFNTNHPRNYPIFLTAPALRLPAPSLQVLPRFSFQPVGYYVARIPLLIHLSRVPCSSGES